MLICIDGLSGQHSTIVDAPATRRVDTATFPTNAAGRGGVASAASSRVRWALVEVDPKLVGAVMKAQAAGRSSSPGWTPDLELVSSWHARWCSRRRWLSAAASSPPRRCSSSCRPLLPGTGGSLRGTSCCVCSSRSCCSSRSDGTHWRSTYRSAWSSGRSRSLSSCSSGWRHCSSIRMFGFGVPHWMRRLRSSSPRLSAPSPSTTDVSCLSHPRFSRVSRSFCPSSSSSISSPVSSRALPASSSVTQFIVCGVAVVAVFAVVEQRTGVQCFRSCSERLSTSAVQRLDSCQSDTG